MNWQKYSGNGEYGFWRKNIYTAVSVCDVYNTTIGVFAASQFLPSHSVANKNNVFNILTRYLKRVSTFHPSKIYCLVKTSENSVAGSRLRRGKKIKHKVRNTLVLCNSVWATRRGTLSGRSRKEILFLKRRRKKYIYPYNIPNVSVCECVRVYIYNIMYIYTVYTYTTSKPRRLVLRA